MSLNYDAITSLVKAKHIPKLTDAIFRSTPINTFVKSHQKGYDGGEKIVRPLIYGEISGMKSYSYYDTLTYDTNIPITSAEFTQKNVVATLIISKDEELKVSGEQAILSLVESKMKIVQESMKKGMATMLYANGTGNGSKDFDGLANAIADDNTYGGIDRATYAWWRAICRSQANDGTTPTQLALATMQRLLMLLSDGSDEPDIILCGRATWLEYYDLVEATLTINSTMGAKMLSYGFKTTEFMGIPVVADPDCPEGQMYFLNTKYMDFMVHNKANFLVTPFAQDDNRLARKQQILLTGNLTFNNSRRQGLLTEILYSALT